MKKVAFCISGLIKNYTNQILINSLNSINCDYDIFWHTWEYISKESVNEAQLIKNNANIKLFVQESDQLAFDNLPISLNDFKCIDQNSPPENVLRMFYSMKRCIEMLESYEAAHDIKYDLIIRIRPDLVFDLLSVSSYIDTKSPNSTINISSLQLNDDEIIMPLKGHCIGKSMDLPILNYIRVSDAFFIGNESVRKLCKTYDNIQSLKEKYNMPMHPEQVVAYSCYNDNLQIKLIGFKCNLIR
jgi:hypothetical protein